MYMYNIHMNQSFYQVKITSPWNALSHFAVFPNPSKWTTRSRFLMTRRSWWEKPWSICLRRRTERRTSGEGWSCPERPSWPTGTTSRMRRTLCSTCTSSGTTTKTETSGFYLKRVNKLMFLIKPSLKVSVIAHLLYELNNIIITNYNISIILK